MDHIDTEGGAGGSPDLLNANITDGQGPAKSASGMPTAGEAAEEQKSQPESVIDQKPGQGNDEKGPLDGKDKGFVKDLESKAS